VDATIDTRELASMIKDAGIDFANLKPPADRGKADDLLGLSTGAATIFGVTGGVMEAMLRLLAEKLDGRELENIEFTNVRGQKGVREAEITAGGKTVRVAVVNGLKYARKICEDAVEGKSPYAAIEVMACPGGCVNGGGQPYPEWNKRNLTGLAWCREFLRNLETRYSNI
jgi:iron only hydrogenase large subunit-like protein